MTTLATTLAALAKTVTDGSGLRCGDHVPDKPNPPEAFVVLTGITEESFGYASMHITADLVVVTSAASDRIGQQKLYELIEPSGSSIWQAIADLPDLGLGDSTQCSLGPWRSLSIEEIAAYRLYGGAFSVMIVT